MAPHCMRIRIAGAVLALVWVCGCAEGPVGLCVSPDCPGNELPSDVPCADGEPEAQCHVVEGTGPCAGNTTCRPDTGDGE